MPKLTYFTYNYVTFIASQNLKLSFLLSAVWVKVLSDSKAHKVKLKWCQHFRCPLWQVRVPLHPSQLPNICSWLSLDSSRELTADWDRLSRPILKWREQNKKGTTKFASLKFKIKVCFSLTRQTRDLTEVFLTDTGTNVEGVEPCNFQGDSWHPDGHAREA